MDQNFNQKLKAGIFVLAVMLMSACSSSQVEENGAVPAETAAAASPGDATTDAVPPPTTDPNAPPVVEDPKLAGGPDSKSEAKPDAAPEVEAPPVDDPNMASAPAPITAPPATDPATDIPTSVQADSSVIPANDPQLNPTMTDPAPIGKGDLASNGHSKKGKHKKGKKGARAAAEMASSGGSAGGSGDYTVQKGDTLMKIAFEQYGDLYRWKEILEANRERIPDPNHVPPGTHLNLAGAGTTTIERNGDRYLIKHGDTLGKISKSLYGNTHKWKHLWENNRQLIKNPNKIYAGFYLYYQPEGKLTDGSSAGDESAAVAHKAGPRAPASAKAVAPAAVKPPAVPVTAPAPKK